MKAAVQTGVALGPGLRIRCLDGGTRLRFRVPVSGSHMRRRHELAMFDEHGRLIGPIRAFTPSKKRGPVFSSSFRGRADVACSSCAKKTHLNPRRPGQTVAFRCFFCLRVYCFKCAAKHFGKQPKKCRQGPNAEITFSAPNGRRV